MMFKNIFASSFAFVFAQEKKLRKYYKCKLLLNPYNAKIVLFNMFDYLDVN